MGAAGEASRQVGDTVGATHGADGGGEAVAVADALSFWFLTFPQSPEQRHSFPSVTTNCSYKRHKQNGTSTLL